MKRDKNSLLIVLKQIKLQTNRLHHLLILQSIELLFFIEIL